MNFLIFESQEIHPKALQILKKNGFSLLTEIKNENDRKKIDAIFVRTYTKVTPQLLNEFPNVKYVLRAGAGLDNIDLDACEKRGIKVISSNGANANAVAELVICFMVLLLRQIPAQMELLKNGKWRSKEKIGSELTDKTIGLIGCGIIARRVAQKLQNFGVTKILGYDPFIDKKTLLKNNIQKSTIDDVLTNSNIISLHLPLTSETKHLIDKAKLKLIKKTAYIINTARGQIIKENDLIESLQKGKIAGAALDVFENEPNINPQLFQIRNLILTPHIGGFSLEADEAISVLAVENLLKAIK